MCQKSKISYAPPLILWFSSQGFQNDKKFESQCRLRVQYDDIFIYYNAYLVKLKLITFRAKKLLIKSCWISLKLSFFKNQILIINHWHFELNPISFYLKLFGPNLYFIQYFLHIIEVGTKKLLIKTSWIWLKMSGIYNQYLIFKKRKF